jgi:hypothetical protein
MFKRLFGLFAVLALFVAGGCGDDGGGENSSDTSDTPDSTDSPDTSESTTTTVEVLVLEEWVSQADDICAGFQEDIDALGDPQTAEEVAAVLEDGIAAAEKQLEDLQALGTPDEKGGTVEDAFDLLQQQIDLLNQASDDIAAGGDPEEVFADINTEGEALDAQLSDLAEELGLEECGADDTTTSTTTPPTTRGGGPVDVPETGDEAIDAMLQECADGNGVACDQAYALTEVGSDAEAFADTCGGTEDAGSICASILGGTKVEPEVTDGVAYGDDPAFDEYYDNCEAGEMSQCDLLYLTSPIGSAYEEFGGTCGGTFSKEDSPFSCVTGE